jgi:hypothetical protein
MYKTIFMLHFSSVPWGCVRLSPFGTSTSNWPIVSAPGDRGVRTFSGMRIGKGNRNSWRKPAQCRFANHKSHINWPEFEPGKPATNRLSYGTASKSHINWPGLDPGKQGLPSHIAVIVLRCNKSGPVRNVYGLKLNLKLRGLSPRANYTDRATATYRRN